MARDYTAKDNILNTNRLWDMEKYLPDNISCPFGTGVRK